MTESNQYTLLFNYHQCYYCHNAAEPLEQAGVQCGLLLRRRSYWLMSLQKQKAIKERSSLLKSISKSKAPVNGSGLLHNLDLALEPSQQAALQEDHSVQGPQLQNVDKLKRNSWFNYWSRKNLQLQNTRCSFSQNLSQAC